MTAPIHSFEKSLAWSEAAGDEPFWEAVYRKAFTNVVAISRNTSNNQGQNLGIDRWISLSNGKTLLVDEKKRSADYQDIAIEYLSNDRTGAPGWIEKDLQIDFLAYAFIPSRRCFLFPWSFLRAAWVRYGNDWRKKYRRIVADNRTYRTHSVCIPIAVLLDAVSSAQVVELPKAPLAEPSSLPTPPPSPQMKLI